MKEPVVIYIWRIISGILGAVVSFAFGMAAVATYSELGFESVTIINLFTMLFGLINLILAYKLGSSNTKLRPLSVISSGVMFLLCSANFLYAIALSLTAYFFLYNAKAKKYYVKSLV